MNDPGWLGAMGALGALLNQSPLTQPFMNAGRTGLAMARHGQTPGAEDDLDFGEAFLNVPNEFGWEKRKEGPPVQQVTPMAQVVPEPMSSMGVFDGPAPAAPYGLLEGEELDLGADPFGIMSM